MKNITILFLVSCILTACEKKELKDPQEGKANATEIAKVLMKIWENGDTTKVNTIFHTNSKYADVANNHIYSGITGVSEYISHIHGWASEVKMTIRKINVTENMGYVEWTLTAQQTSPIEGRVPLATNNKFTLNGVTLLEFDKGKIMMATDYMDVLSFVRQLGSKIELPGGLVIGE